MKPFVIPSIFTAVDKVTAVTRTIGNSIHSMAERAAVSSVRTERFFRGVGKAADGIFDKIVNVRNALAVGLVGSAGLQLYKLTADMASMGDELSTTAARLGMTTQAFQELSYAAKLQNIEQETLTGSFEKLNKNLGDLHHGQGALYSKLHKTNPALTKQLKLAKDSEQAFNLISAAIVKLPNQMDRAALSQAAFGKSGQQMLNLIQAGPETIAQMRLEAQKLGFVLSDEMIAAAQKFDDANDRMTYTVLGLKVSIGSGLMPVIQQYMEKATAWVMTHKQLIQVKVAEYADKIKNTIVFLSQNMDKIILGTKIFIGTLITLKVVSIASTAAIYAANTALFLFNVTMGLAAGFTGTMTKAVAASKVAMVAYKVATGIATIATAAYSFAQGVLATITGTVTGTLLASKAATYGVIAATKVASVITGVWTAAQWLLNVALTANPIGIVVVAIGALIAIIAVVANKTTGWGQTWDNVMKWMGNVFDFFKQNLVLRFKLIEHGFMLMVDGIVLAWKWGQNKLGQLSDQQYAADKARIQEAQRLRVEGIRNTTAAMIEAGKKSLVMPQWTVEWKEKNKPAEQANTIMQKTNIVKTETVNESSGQTNIPDPAPVRPINPKAQQQRMMDYMLNIGGGTKSKEKIEVEIKTPPGTKATVTKNSGGIPVKTSTTLGWG